MLFFKKISLFNASHNFHKAVYNSLNPCLFTSTKIYYHPDTKQLAIAHKYLNMCFSLKSGNNETIWTFMTNLNFYHRLLVNQFMSTRVGIQTIPLVSIFHLKRNSILKYKRQILGLTIKGVNPFHSITIQGLAFALRWSIFIALEFRYFIITHVYY